MALLLDHGADPNVRDLQERTAPHVALDFEEAGAPPHPHPNQNPDPDPNPTRAGPGPGPEPEPN